jgi:hypothetical protein
MAVIKIVPMPGAVGDKGDEGAVGPQGQQGPAGQNGLPGTPALWSYQGTYNSSAAYAVGDVVVYQGQLYYTKSVTTAGTLPTDTAKFDLIASKGADGQPGANGTNGTNGTDFGIYYLGNYNPSSGYVPDIAVVRGSDGQLYLAKASGQLGDPVGNTAQWEVWIPKGADGTNGADALWNYTGEYNGGASYAVGDIATYDGQLWYRYNANGGNVGDTPSPGLWNLLAAKGADGSQLNYWDGIEQPNPHQPAEPGFLVVDGITNNQTLQIMSADKIYIGGNGGEFINDPNVPSNQIATLGDIAYYQNSSFAEVPYTVSGGALGTQPTFDGAPLFAGSYTKTGNLVHFRVNVSMSNITNFGSGQYYVSIPFTSEYDVYVRNGQLKHSSGDMYSVSGHATAGSNELRLYTTASNGKEVAFTSSSPVGLNTTCDFHIFGSYFSTPNA